MMEKMCSGLISMAAVMGDVSVQNGAAQEGNFEIRDGVLIKYNDFDENVVIPAGVIAIGREAFSGCFSLSSVTIPAGAAAIGEQAFSGCESLKPELRADIESRFGKASITLH